MNSNFDTVLAPLEWVVAWLMVGFHTILTPIGLPAQACFTWPSRQAVGVQDDGQWWPAA